MSEFHDYGMALARRRPEVERIRDAARSRGDLMALRNTETLLSQWAVPIERFAPANDARAGLVDEPRAPDAGNRKRQLSRQARSTGDAAGRL